MFWPNNSELGYTFTFLAANFVNQKDNISKEKKYFHLFFSLVLCNEIFSEENWEPLTIKKMA